MAEHLSAYFKSENDADAALARLQKLKVSKAYVDNIPEDHDLDIIMPIGNIGGEYSNITGGSAIAGQFFSNAIGDKTEFTHLLEFEVEDEDVAKALQQLREANAHMDESTINKQNL